MLYPGTPPCIFTRATHPLVCTHSVHRWKAHGFLVPSAKKLVDPMGLFAYLQEKICRFNTCLKCNRPFDSLEAVRMHMRDVSHCRVNCDDEDGALELSRFYTAKTAGSAAETAAAFTLMVHGSAGEAAMCPDTGELVLPSGARLGHRSLQKYAVALAPTRVVRARGR